MRQSTFFLLFFIIQIAHGQLINYKFYCYCFIDTINNEEVLRDNCSESLIPYPDEIKNGNILIYNKGDSSTLCTKIIKDSINNTIIQIQYYYQNKKYLQKIETEDSIIEIFYYSNGNIKESRTYLTKEYEQVGKWIFYYDNGNIRKETLLPCICNKRNYVIRAFGKYLRNEMWTYYYPNGKMKMKTYFDIEEYSYSYLIDFYDEVGNQLVRNGNGEIKNYDKTGRVNVIKIYKKGLLSKQIYP